MSRAVDSTGYLYPDEIMVLDAEWSQSETMRLLTSVEAINCDDCNRAVVIGTWAYITTDEAETGEDIVMHPACLFKVPCTVGSGVLIRGDAR